MLGNMHNKPDARHQEGTEERAGNGAKSQTALETELVPSGRVSVSEGQAPAKLLPHSITAIPKVISMLEPFVEADAAAEFLHYSPRSIKQMAREGRIPAHPFGSGPRKRWYFLISELAEHLRAQVNSAYGEAGRDKTQRRVI
jgi:Helix-turn-helix domain